MGKYNSRQNVRKGPNPKTTVNPYMRGIGCLMMVIVPVFSYLGAADLVKTQSFGWQFLPAEWYNQITIPANLTGNVIFGLVSGWFVENEIYPAALVIAAVFTFVAGGLISIVFGYMYTLMAPSKYGPTDVPPPRVKTKKYKR